jgi:hypothetical protein
MRKLTPKEQQEVTYLIWNIGLWEYRTLQTQLIWLSSRSMYDWLVYREAVEMLNDYETKLKNFLPTTCK